MKRKYIFFLAIILLAGLTLAATESPYARRIRPVTGGFPVSCIENEVAYDMTSHVFGICNNSGTYQAVVTGSGSFANTTLSNLTSPTAINQNLIFAVGTSYLQFGTGVSDRIGYTNGVGPKFTDDGTARTLTFNTQSLSANRILTVPNEAGTICTTGSICSGYQASGSFINGSGTTNSLSKFTSSTSLGNSQITDDGTDVTINSIGTFGVNTAGGAINLNGTSANTSTFKAGTVGLEITGQDADNTILLTALTINLDSKGGVTTIGDVAGAGNNITLKIDDFNMEIRAIGADLIVQTGSLISNGVVTGGGIFPQVAAVGDVGNTSLPFSSLIIGNAVNNSSQITGTFTGNRVATLPDATGIIQLVGTANTGTILGIPINNTVLATATGTVYSSPGNDGTALSIATEGNVSFPITRTGTIRNLFVRTGGTAKINTPTTVIIIRKNGVDTTVTLTMTQTINTTTSDITHSFTVVAGDLITVSFTTTGVAGVSTSIAGVSFELD